VNRDAVLTGTVRLARLLLADSEQQVSELTAESLLFVHPDAKDHEVFELFDKYNLRSLTVVDGSTRPVGMITVDDVVSHMRARL